MIVKVFSKTAHRCQNPWLIYALLPASFFSFLSPDKTLALLDHHCGGNISLDQKPAGHINLTLPGLYTDTDRLNHTNNQSDKNLSLCTWLIDISVGRTVRLKLVQLKGGSSISVHCGRTEEDHDQVLENGQTALLTGCDRNKATLTWTGTGHYSIQLAYYGEKPFYWIIQFNLLSQCGPLGCTCTLITRIWSNNSNNIWFRLDFRPVFAPSIFVCLQ